MNAYTYFVPIKHDHAQLDPDNERAVLSLWERSWRNHGWNPIVLSQTDAAHHPHFEAYAKAVRALPTLNPFEYSCACYYRWAAMTQAGGGLMSDYDVMNYGFTPEHATELHAKWTTGLLCLDRFIPCVMSGPAEDYWRVCQTMAGFSAPLPHVSDMNVLKYHLGGDLYTPTFVVKEYTNPGWEAAPLVHFATGRAQRDKAAIIQRERPV